MALQAIRPSGHLDFDSFLARLGEQVAPARLEKAKQMLKSERFELYSDVGEDSLVGEVKSHSNPKLVYSCRLSANGSFGCCTQNLKPCGGLHGALCKHILVLLIGLTRAKKLGPATADVWLRASRLRKPAIDQGRMAATFLRDKGAEAGKVDWRPTETIPEDYYAL